MSNSTRTETESWLLSQRDGYSVIGQMDQAKHGKEFLSSLWPFLNSYFSTLTPIHTSVFQWFLSDRSKRFPAELMIRDGAVPLAWFFKKYSPSKIASRLLIHEDLEGLVPNEWRSQVNLYGWRSIASEFSKPPEALILAGPIDERVIDLAQVDDTLDAMERTIGKSSLTTMPVKLFCPLRGDGETFHAKYLQKIFSRLKNVEIVDWRSLEASSSFMNDAFVELNGGWLYQDSYVQQFLLSRGARLLLAPTRTEKCRFVPLSRFHGVEIVKLSANKFVPNDPAGKFQTFFTQTARVSGQVDSHDALWPNWHEKLCRAMPYSKRKLQRNTLPA